MEEIQQILCDVLKCHFDRDPTEIEFQQFACALTSFQGLFNSVIDHPRLIAEECLSTGHSTSLVFPCNVVELRQVLGGTMSIDSDFVPLFANGFAERHLKAYPVFLILNQNNVSVDLIDLGGVVLAQCTELSVESNVTRVVVNQPSSDRTIAAVKGIIYDCLPKVEMLVSNSIPGISAPSRQLAGKNKKEIKTAQKMEINLTPAEANLFNKLKNMRDQAGLTNVELRIAGGWIRDKLLGVDSADIDIALSNITGAEFVEKLGIGGAVIQANPDKSKHLETVKAHIDGQEIDFVNLRSEAYADSRVPEMQMGTPEEDARRRDFTINAMFFNLETGQIEDYVGGKADLQQGLIKTPLDAKQTFQDDPLRVLRALRFFARYPGFELDPSIVEAMQDPEVQNAYSNKVASERAGKEFFGKDEEGNYKGIAIGDNASNALDILLKTGFYKSVFNIEQMDKFNDFNMDQQSPYHDLTVMDHTVAAVRNLQKMMKENNESKRMTGLMVLSSLFHDLGKLDPNIKQPHPDNPEQMRYIGHEDVSADTADAIMKHMGIGDQDRRVVETVIKNHMKPHSQDMSPKAMGKFIRNTTVPGQEDLGMWKYIMYHAIADSQAKGIPKEDDIAEKRDRLEQMTKYVDQRAAQPSASIGKSLLNGNEIMTLVPELLPKTGFIKEVQDMLLDFADAGEITTPDQARQKVLEWKTQNLNRYQTETQIGTQSMNWFKRVKKADGSGGGGGGESTDDSLSYYEGDPVADKDDGITHPQDVAYKDTQLENQIKDVSRLKRHPVVIEKTGPPFERTEGGGAKYNDTIKVPFQEGDKIRDRRRGTAMKQRFGKIVKLDNKKGKLSIQWDNAKEEEDIQLNDTVTLAAILGKA